MKFNQPIHLYVMTKPFYCVIRDGGSHNQSELACYPTEQQANAAALTFIRMRPYNNYAVYVRREDE